jgi:Bromodomain/HMG (high mobility group) box
MDHLRHLLKKEDPYYPVVEGCDNPYRDGYATEPPKKPRASYLFFQCTVRSFFVKKKPNAPQSELMALLGEAWRAMDDNDKEPYQILANEEAKQYVKEKILLEKAQKPNGVWQPLRRCRQVLERLAKDSFADIFLEPVNLEDFPDYEEVIDVMMDLGTVRQRLETRKYQAPEQFARDMRRVRKIMVVAALRIGMRRVFFFLVTHTT